MRSTIDWNEIVPRLTKGIRDTLFLEAITMLSAECPQTEPIARVRAKRIPGNLSVRRPEMRTWGHNGSGGRLCYPGRVFKILRGRPNPPSNGLIGGVWKKLLECKTDTITYEGIASICKGVGVDKGKYSAIVGGLWSRGFIDVLDAKQPHKVGEAY